VKSLEVLVGKYGRSLSPLRPVGTCEFGGRRIECVAEMGMIESDCCVQATEIRGRTLAVDVEHAPILDVRAPPDANVIHVSPDHSVEPDARLFAQLHVPDDLGGGRDERGGVVLGNNPLIGMDHRSPPGAI
jgi:hypothetical protein